jgi:GMP synthase (glutamine-hydrolysing)
MILIVDMNCKKSSLGFYEFVMPIASVVKEYETKHYSEVKDVDDFEKIILSGVPLKDNEFMKDVKKFDWIKDCGKPILGICAGMQAIGMIFNSTLKKCQEIGMCEIETVKKNPLFSSSFKAYELHNFSIEPSKDLEVLAMSDKCIQAIKHKEKNIYGILFHPEIRNREIIERFSSFSSG